MYVVNCARSVKAAVSVRVQFGINRVTTVYAQPTEPFNQNGRQGDESRSPQRPPRDVTINVRAKQSQRDLIDHAAQVQGKSRSEFILETACLEAEAVLLDRRLFGLDEQKFQQFLARLDAPPAENEKLRALLTRPAPWD